MYLPQSLNIIIQTQCLSILCITCLGEWEGENVKVVNEFSCQVTKTCDFAPNKLLGSVLLLLAHTKKEFNDDIFISFMFAGLIQF